MAVYFAAPDTTRSVVADNLILERSADALSLYLLGDHGYEWLGSYATAAEAWAALDLIDA